MTATRWTRFGHALLFDPTTRDSVRWNLFDDCPIGDGAIAYLQNAVEILTEDTDAGHWKQAAIDYLVMSALHLLYAGKDEDKNLGGLRRHVERADVGCQEMIDCAAHPKIVALAEMMMSAGGSKGEREESKSGYRASVYNSAGVLLRLYDDPIVDDLTSRSEFSLADLQCAEHPVRLYLVVRPSDAQRIRPLIKLMLVQARRALMKDEQVSADGVVKNHRVLMCMDEFTDFNMQDIVEATRSMASYGFKGLFAAQSYADVYKLYGEGLGNNCGTHIVYRPNDYNEAVRVSRIVGQVRETVKRTSKSYEPMGMMHDKKSISESEEVRPILPPDELMAWEKRKHSIVLGHGKPILADVLKFHEHKRWSRMVLPPPERTRDESGAYFDLPGKFTSPWLGRYIEPPKRNDPEAKPAAKPARGRPSKAATEAAQAKLALPTDVVI